MKNAHPELAKDLEPDNIEGWEPLAIALCEEDGEDPHEMIYDGGPIPQPWGERWLRYEDAAKRMIALVGKYAAKGQADGWVSATDAQDLKRFGFLMADLTRHVQMHSRPGQPMKYRVIEDCEPITGWHLTPAAALDAAMAKAAAPGAQQKEGTL